MSKNKISSKDSFIVESFKDFQEKTDTKLSESINIETGEWYEGDQSKELEAANNFKHISEVITVVNCEADLKDDFNSHVEIEMSNGDKIEYDLRESRNPVGSQSAPPYYTTFLKINGQEFFKDSIEWIGEFSDGTIIGSILNYYKQGIQDWKR